MRKNKRMRAKVHISYVQCPNSRMFYLESGKIISAIELKHTTLMTALLDSDGDESDDDSPPQDFASRGRSGSFLRGETVTSFSFIFHLYGV